MDEFSSGLSEQQLKYGYWYSTHQIMVRRVILFAVYSVIGLLFGYSLYGAIDWQLLHGAKERKLVLGMQADKVDFIGAKTRAMPRSLTFTNTTVLSNGDGVYDVVTTVRNPNNGWLAEIDYYFSYENKQTPSETGFVLPGEEALFPVYRIPDPGSATPTFRTKEIRWKKISPHDIGPYLPWSRARMRFEINLPTNTVIEFEGKHVLKTNFTVTNRSAFSYWSLPLTITLKNGDTLLAIQTISLDQLKSGETRPVEVSWYSSVPTSAAAEVAIHVNLLDEGVYMRSKEAPIADIRDEFEER